MSDDTAAVILAFATENAELRVQLAEAQDLLVETAVDAGELHARVEHTLKFVVVRPLPPAFVQLIAQRAGWVAMGGLPQMTGAENSAPYIAAWPT